MEFNEYLSTLELLDLESKPKEVLELFYDFINTVPYIKAHILKNIPRACDLPKDAEGKIIINITLPHIFENMDYFRPTALHYQKYGCLTLLRPNANPNSEYGKWLREEVRRCYEGYVRKSDGEWITGDMYFFLNYCPILLTKVRNGRKAERVWDFPEFWEGHYYKFHYINQARNNGHHGAELAARSRGKSYTLASMIAKRFILGESRDVNKEVKCLVTAYLKEYLTKDGILNKFQSYIDFCALNTLFPSKRLKSSLLDMSWTMGYIDLDTGTRKGTLNEVLGISSKDDESKLRGKRGVLIALEEWGSFPNLLGLYGTLRPSVEEGDAVFGLIFAQGCVCAGTKVWTNDGRNINIEDLRKEDGIVGYSNNIHLIQNYTTILSGATKEPIGSIINLGEKECVEITLSNGNKLQCSTDHPIYTLIVHTPRKPNEGGRRYRIFEERFKEAGELKIGDRVCECRTINNFGTDSLFDARLVGMLIGDGSYGYDNSPKYSSEDIELLQYIKNSYDCTVFRGHITKKGNNYEELRIRNLCKRLRECGIYGLTKTKKRLPLNYQTLDKQNCMDLLSGLYDTDGSIRCREEHSSIILTQGSKEILEQVIIIWRKFGVIGRISEIKPRIGPGRKDKNACYNLIISGRRNLLRAAKVLQLLVKHKRERLSSITDWFNTNPSKKPCGYSEDLIVYKITDIKPLGVQTIYNLSACCSHTYLANNIITHNTAGDSSSDFASAQEIMYNPLGYNMLEVNNVYDKEGQGRKYFVYFFPGYINRKGCYDKNGNSDVTKALLEILMNRYTVKYNSTDINAISKAISEVPVTPLEAIIRTTGSIFPITELTERLNLIDNTPNFYDSTYVGELVFNKDKHLEFIPTTDIPIRDFPTKDNKVKGALEIFNMPEKDPKNEVPLNRYITFADPYDDDASNTMSLGSVMCMDLWTDTIVAEYTGRPMFADDYFEIVRKLTIFYNARCIYENNKKGLFSYFSRYNCVYLLADTPEYLRDKQLIKDIGYGNKAKGIPATLPIKNYGYKLIRDWLLKPYTRIEKDDNGNEVEILMPNLYRLKNRALIKELILWNPDINVDRIMALVLGMLYREEKMILYNGDLSSARNRNTHRDYLGEDPFFKNNYSSNNIIKLTTIS